VGALEILRAMTNCLETDQQLLPGGTTAAMEKFATTPIARPDGTQLSLTAAGALRLNTQVMKVSSKNGQPSLTLQNADGASSTESFDAVIYTGSPRSAEHAHLTLPTDQDADAILSEGVKTAIQQTHLINSSKLFIQVEKQFWKDDPTLPQTIQTDESLHGAYCLAYPGSERGVVLMSYTWEDKSAKLQAVPAEERFALFKAQIAKICPEFAVHLKPVGGIIHCIDWQAEKHQYGAFKLDHAGQSERTLAARTQFKSALADDDQPKSGVFLAGDGVAFEGGWIEAALSSGINAACATLHHLGGTLAPNAPLLQDTNIYSYTAR
jgi:tryptophan 2-monooxygenase